MNQERDVRGSRLWNGGSLRLCIQISKKQLSKQPTQFLSKKISRDRGQLSDFDCAAKRCNFILWQGIIFHQKRSIFSHIFFECQNLQETIEIFLSKSGIISKSLFLSVRKCYQVSFPFEKKDINQKQLFFTRAGPKTVFKDSTVVIL